jgi:hypothetical protein
MRRKIKAKLRKKKIEQNKREARQKFKEILFRRFQDPLKWEKIYEKEKLQLINGFRKLDAELKERRNMFLIERERLRGILFRKF